MTTPILLTGGTGTLGRHVTKLLQAQGRPLRVLSRHPHASADSTEYVVGDLTTGAGIEAAVAGVTTIVHCAGSSSGDDVKARHLVRAVESAQARGAVATSRHLVNISVVGADRVPVVSRVDRGMFGYFASKRAAELVITESGLPWTNLRATQFYDLAWIVASAMAKLPVIPMPTGVRFQPVDTGEVAARLVELAAGSPAGQVPDIAGPTIYPMGEMIREYLRATHRRRLMMPIRLGGRAYRAIRAGANLAPEHAVGRRTWEEYLADRVAATA